MTTLAVAFFFTAFAQRAQPRPAPRQSCRDAWDCAGQSNYCWPGSNDNYCAEGNGIGSLCLDDYGCGLLGERGVDARWMYCSKSYRRAEVAPRPRLPGDDVNESSGHCLDPWGSHGNVPYGRRLDATNTETEVVIENETRREEEPEAQAPQEGTISARLPARRKDCQSSYDCWGDSYYCYEGWSGNYCKYGTGLGALCRSDSSCGYLGRGDNSRPMYCSWEGKCRDPWGRRLDEEPSLTKSDAVNTPDEVDSAPAAAGQHASVSEGDQGSGMITVSGSGDDGMGSGVESDDTQEAGDNQHSVDTQDSGVSHNSGDQEPTTKDSRRRAQPEEQELGKINPYSNTGCQTADDCDGIGEYCYSAKPRNVCRYTDGTGSLCQSNDGCGWVGRGDFAHKLYCSSRGRCRVHQSGRRLEQQEDN